MILTDSLFNANGVVSSFRRTQDINNEKPNLLAAFFPDRKTMSIKLDSISHHRPIDVQLAASNFDAMPTLRTRGTFNLESREMAFFRESDLVREYDLIELMKIESMNNPYLEEIMERIYDGPSALLRGADIVPELMRAQLLAPVDGSPKISIIDNNVTYQYNYDTDGSYQQNNYTALSGTSKWDAPTTAKPFDDFRDVKRKLGARGYTPSYALMSQKTFDYLMAMDSVRNVVLAQNLTATIDLDDDTILRTWRKKTNTEIIIYDKMRHDKATNTDVPFFPDNYVTFIPSGPLGYTWYGMTPEERSLRGDSKVDVRVLENGVAVAVQREYGPPVKTTTTVSMITLPTYDRMDETYVLKVA